MIYERFMMMYGRFIKVYEDQVLFTMLFGLPIFLWAPEKALYSYTISRFHQGLSYSVSVFHHLLICWSLTLAMSSTLKALFEEN